MTEHATADTRRRLLAAAEQLFRTQGYAGTGLKQLTRAAETPWGSLYHFFPAGKEQLGAEVMAYAGELYLAGWRAAFDRFGDPAEAVERIFLGEAALLEKSDYRDGCPIASVTLDAASTSDHLRQACAAGFEAWLACIRGALTAVGAPEATAAALAGFILATLEGAIVLARAARSPVPLLQSARFVRKAIETEARTWGGRARNG
jgi:AcrR family transcriptional regulator